MELEGKLGEFSKRGVSIIGISYDPVEILKAFSDKYKITYPLLSDIQSETIKSFGILKKDISPDSKTYGIPYPGIYIVDKNLKVVSKQFEEAYADRPSAETLLAHHFGKELTSHVRTFKNSYLNGSIALSDTFGYPAQILSVQIKISMKSGFHLYGRPIPAGYIPLSIKIEPNPNFKLDDFIFPGTKTLSLPGLDETFNILPGELDLQTNMRVIKSPLLDKFGVNVIVEFQACDDRVCMPPEEVKITFPLLISKDY